MPLVFFDTETTGTDRTFDQILQFAAVMTDENFEEEDRFNIRCRLLPHIVPSPSAMRVTGVTVAHLVDRSLPSHYQMVAHVRKKFLEYSPATFLGYNTIEFDERLLRQAFYQNLFPAYITNTDGNCRSDVMRAVLAAALHTPGAVTVPQDEKGGFQYKLELVAPANGYIPERAHDALDDVRATIHMARLVSEKAPETWSAFMRFSSKAAVVDYLRDELVLVWSEVYFGRPWARHVTWIGYNEHYTAEQYMLVLDVDPDGLARMSDPELTSRLASNPKPVRVLRANAMPMLMPDDEAPKLAPTWQVGLKCLRDRAGRLRENKELRQRLVAAFERTRSGRGSGIHVEQKIYDGFVGREDEKRMERFHRLPWKERIDLVSAFDDPRLRELGRRLIYNERPDVLDDDLRRQYDSAVAARTRASDGDAPWRTLPKALEQAEDQLRVAEASERKFIEEHRDYLRRRLEAAYKM